MKRDIQKAIEEIKSAGMEEFLHQDPTSFECEEEHSSHDRCSNKRSNKKEFRCPKTKCTHVKKCTFVTKVTRVKKCTFVTKVTRVKKCTFVTKCVHFQKKCFWTKRCFCDKCVSHRKHDKCSCRHKEHHDKQSHSQSSCHNKKSNRKKKKHDHWWFKKGSC